MDAKKDVPSHAEFQQFLALSREPPDRRQPHSLNALFRLDAPSAARAMDEFVEAGRKVRRIHPVYRWLEAQPGFRKIWGLFEKKRSAAPVGKKIRRPEFEFELLHTIVANVDFAFALAASRARDGGKGRRHTYGPTKSNRKSAISHIESLIALEARGVSLSGFKGAQLRTLLIEFRTQLQKTRRKERGGPTATLRAPAKHFAQALNWLADWRSPASVEAFAELVGIECDGRTAQRYVNEAARFNRELLAQALANYMDREGDRKGAD